MKTNSFSIRSVLGVLLAFVLLMVVFEACKKDDNPAVISADKTRLKARLDSANTAYNAATEGVQVGQYETGSKTTFKSLIDAATTVNGNANASQTDVNNAYANLGQAISTFASKKVQEIAPANLVLYLKMDGNANDASGKGFNGTLKTGDSAGIAKTILPILAPDRYGVANKAYSFSLGSNIEIPYNPALNPAKEMTISLWARPARIYENNYILGLNRWNGYKFQLQSVNKTFFTVHTGTSIYNRDTDPRLEVNTWYHLAVTYKSGEMVFYVNGAETQKYTDVQGDIVSSNSAINLTIGQDMPTSAKNDVKEPGAGKDNLYREWGGYFNGSLDEVRIYNAVLSGTQVRSIYNAEKP